MMPSFTARLACFSASRRGDVLVAAAAVLLEQLSEALVIAVGRRHELRLGTALLHECAALGLHRRATLLACRRRSSAPPPRGAATANGQLSLPREELHELQAALSRHRDRRHRRRAPRPPPRASPLASSSPASRAASAASSSAQKSTRWSAGAAGILRSGGAPVGRSHAGAPAIGGSHLLDAYLRPEPAGLRRLAPREQEG